MRRKNDIITNIMRIRVRETHRQEPVEMSIPFLRTDDPCFESDGKTAYRIFVFGKNIRDLNDFQKKYYTKINRSCGGNGIAYKEEMADSSWNVADI